MAVSPPMARSAMLRDHAAKLSRIEQDPAMRRFFAVLTRALQKDTANDLLVEILEYRPSLSTDHLLYLFFAACQHVSGFGFDDSSVISDELLLSWIGSERARIIELCETKTMATHVLNRYVALQLVLGAHTVRNLTVVDLGCSSGLALRSLNTPILRLPDVVPTEIRRFVRGKADIESAIGVDLTNPTDLDVTWLESCVPPEIKWLRPILHANGTVGSSNGPAFRFVSSDLRDLPRSHQIPRASVDVVWTSSVAYQLADNHNSAFSAIWRVANWLLVKGGVWIHAGYEIWNSEFAAADNPYWITAMIQGEPFDSMPMRILSSASDNVDRLSIGPDFDHFLSILR